MHGSGWASVTGTNLFTVLVPWLPQSEFAATITRHGDEPSVTLEHDDQTDFLYHAGPHRRDQEGPEPRVHGRYGR